jgi:hypothetical protein
MLMRTDPFRELDRFANQVLGTARARFRLSADTRPSTTTPQLREVVDT